MFFVSREATMRGIAALGSSRCCYMPGAISAEEWVKPTTYCDCKYGFDGTQSALTEQTGCPELKSLYRTLEAMSDEQWQELATQAGGIL